MKVAKDFVLIRLEPGPAEHLFGITAAPMAVIADWHGRVQQRRFNLRGEIPAACQRLRDARREFDFRAARRPPFAVPKWAEELVRPGGERAMRDLLEKVHPAARSKRPDPRQFEALAELFPALDREGELLTFCTNYRSACEERVPAYGETYRGYEAEVELLRAMTWSHNDRIKFEAIESFGRFAPVGDVGFLLERAERREEQCSNPNVVLCRCLSAVALAVERYPGPQEREARPDYPTIVDLLPALVEVLEREGRNNGACTYALVAIRTIAEHTGAPEALEAYLHEFRPPEPDSEWLVEHTARHLEDNLDWLQRVTREEFGPDFEAWQRWYEKNRTRLYYDAGKGRFVIDARAARAHRKRVGR